MARVLTSGSRPGRGGGSGADLPRRPRPAPLAGSAVATESPDLFLDTASTATRRSGHDRSGRAVGGRRATSGVVSHGPTDYRML
jgi:hypothetical protein